MAAPVSDRGRPLYRAATRVSEGSTTPSGRRLGRISAGDTQMAAPVGDRRWQVAAPVSDWYSVKRIRRRGHAGAEHLLRRARPPPPPVAGCPL